MTATLIVLLIITLLAILILPFTRSLMKDRAELHKNPMDQKFGILISRINQLMMNGCGEVVNFKDDPRMLNLFDENHPNMIIQLYYSTGTLSITLKYKYFHVELVRKMEFHDMRHAETFRQLDTANYFAEEAQIAIREHQEKVGREQGFIGPSGDLIFTPAQKESGIPLRDIYSDLNKQQKLELLNMARIIFLADGSPMEEFRDSAVLRQLLLNLQIDYDTFDKEVATRPALAEMNQMYRVDQTIQIMSLLPVVVASRRNPDARMEALYRIFEQMNIGRDRVDAIISRMSMIANQFNV